MEAVCGITSEKTRASRTRRAISCAYCAPKSTTNTGRSAGPALSRSERSATAAGLVERKHGTHGVDVTLVAVEFDASQGRFALGVGRSESGGDEICRAGRDRDRRFAVRAGETALRNRELETTAIDLNATCHINTSGASPVEAQQNSGQEPVQWRYRAHVDRVQPVQAKPRDALQDGQDSLPARVAERVDGAPNRGRQVGALDQPIVLELFEPLSEQIGRDAGQLGAQIAVAAGPSDQLAQDQQCPSLTQDVEPAGDRAVLVVVPGSHDASLTNADIFFHLLLENIVY